MPGKWHRAVIQRKFGVIYQLKYTGRLVRSLG